MALLARKAVILAKREATYGTDAVPVGANAILVSNLSVTPQAAEFAERDLIRPYYGASDKLPTAISAMCEFTVELAGSGTAGTAPAWGLLLRACGFQETLTAAQKAEYAPVSAGFESLSLAYSLGSETTTRVVHKMLGARGTLTLEVNAKAIPVMKFKFQGLYSAVADDATALTPDFSGFQTPLPSNGQNTPTFTLHGVSSPLSAFSVDVGNKLAFRSLIGGAESVKITDRAPTGSVTFEATTVAAKDWWETARLATKGALQLVHGVTAGNIVEITAPAVQVNDPTYSDQDGVAMLKVGLAMIPGSAGNDELKIIAR